MKGEPYHTKVKFSFLNKGLPLGGGGGGVGALGSSGAGTSAASANVK